MIPLSNKDVFARNLQRYMESRGKSRRDVCEDLGFSYYTFSDWVNGKKYPRMDKVEMLARYFGIKKSDLIEDDPEDDPIEQGRASDHRPLPAGLSPVRVRRIPIIGHVAAGVPIMAEREYEEYEDDTYGIACDYVLRVEGDSMEPRILDGDVVYVRQQPDVDDGQIAVVGVDDSVTLKVVYHMPGGLQLVSLNPKYKPMIYTQDNTDYLAIIGKAVAFKRRL